MKNTEDNNAGLADATGSAICCEFRLLNDDLCGRPAFWRWSRFRGTTRVETFYCETHGNDMRGEGMCADIGSWSILPSNAGAQPPADATGSATGLTIIILEHPKGFLMRIEHDGAAMTLDRAETFDLYEKLSAKLGGMPVKL